MSVASASAGEVDWAWALERLRGAYSDATLEHCVRRFDHFVRWCAAAGRVAVPPSAETAAAYLESLFGPLRPDTVLNHVYAIRRVCLALEVPDPTDTPAVSLVLRKGRRRWGAPPRQAAPINAVLRDRLRAACPDTLLGLRDRAFLSLAYDTLCRPCELVALLIEDLEGLPDGTGRIRVRREKQAPGGGGSMAYLSAQGVADVRAWLERARLTAGPILRPLVGHRHGRKIAARPWQAASMIPHVKRLARRAGVEAPERFSGYSLRIGALQDLVIGGASLLQIMRAGRWRNADIVAHYARDTPVNMWGQTDGDGYPLAKSFHGARARALAQRGRGRRRARSGAP